VALGWNVKAFGLLGFSVDWVRLPDAIARRVIGRREEYNMGCPSGSHLVGLFLLPVFLDFLGTSSHQDVYRGVPHAL